jgi:hypothetical protein
MRTRVPATIAALALLAPAASQAAPILEGPNSSPSPRFIGEPATPDPVYAPDPPRHPHMAANGRSNIHDDAYQTDTYQGSGPLGRGIGRLSEMETLAECGSVNFDTEGRIVTVCVHLVGSPVLALKDPRTLSTLAEFSLPARQLSANAFTDFSGGGYFYLDNRDRAVVPTASRHIYVVGATPGPGFSLERDYDLTGAVAEGDKIIATMPDWSGRIWFVSVNGVVGTIEPSSGRVRSLDTREPIGNSFAVDESGGVYIVTDGAMYRFDADSGGAPRVTWREPYSNIGTRKPGQTQAGSGTTPTLMGRDYVAITDNADPMNVVVYRRARALEGGRRLVCSQPVFAKGSSSTDNSLIGTERSLVVENNYGYTGPTATFQGGLTAPGLERVDVDRDGSGCHTVWKSSEASPSVVPKLSLRNGLVYAYTKTASDADPWYLTAIDFRTGKTVFKALAGEGLGFNNNYAPVTIGLDGTAYVGVLGGLAALRDERPPSEVAPRAPRLSLSLSRQRRGRLRMTVGGADRELVRRVQFQARGRRIAGDELAPFTRTVRRRALRGSTSVRARVALHDGRVLRYNRRVPRRARARAAAVAVRLSVTYVARPGTPTRRATLRCGRGAKATGFLAAKRALRRLCAAARRLSRFLSAKPNANRYCTQIYGGPNRARVIGRVGARRVNRVFSRRNGCEIADWNRAALLLPRPRLAR